MKKLLLILVIAAAPGCGKKNSPAPANAGTVNKMEGEKAADPCAGKTADPCGGTADPCADKGADPCAGQTP